LKVVFIHQNCPGQFKYLAPHLASQPGNEVVFLTQPGKPNPPGVSKVEYRPARKPSRSIHHYLRLSEEGILNGQAAAMRAQKLKASGFYPDLIVAHMGWGEGLYIKEIWPRAKLLGYFEWYYHAHGSDVGFAEREAPDLETSCRITTRNFMHLYSLESVDWGISPTRWQWQQHPAVYRDKISVIHDGIDTQRITPLPDSVLDLPNGRQLSKEDEVVTYVARNLEPYRGFPTFMRAAELILKRRPNCQIVVVGTDEVSYGAAPKGDRTYRQQMLDELDLDQSRIHFLGRVPYSVFLQVLQVSSAHIYLTVPFVLSWSVLEAMAAGCLVIGSKTPPVVEVLKDRRNGLLVDFFTPVEIADRVDEVLDHPDRMQALRESARRTIVQHYSLDECLAQQTRLIEDLAAARVPVSHRNAVEHPPRLGAAARPKRSAKGRKRRKAG
jgi:glycosyltransferase involved in cell wall biosynthesis